MTRKRATIIGLEFFVAVVLIFAIMIMLRAAADAPRAARILQQDVYGWFERIDRGVYGLSPAGRRGLETFAAASV